MAEILKTLKDVPVGHRCILFFDHKSRVEDQIRYRGSEIVVRSELKRGKNGQEHMVTRLGPHERRLSFSASTMAIDMDAPRTDLGSEGDSGFITSKVQF